LGREVLLAPLDGLEHHAAVGSRPDVLRAAAA
jgi:hypothetical protein